MATQTAEKAAGGMDRDAIQPAPTGGVLADDFDPKVHETHEVFKETSEGVNFRTVSWQRAAVIFVKIQFAMSILSVPASLATLGAVGGSLSIVGWGALNTCMSISCLCHALHEY